MPAQQYVLGICYDGSSFYGWQRQADVASVQESLEQALSRVADHPIRMQAAGRTDRGVHATGQVASFFSDAARTEDDWLRGGNALTPASISIDWVVKVAEHFHPRYSAVARTYHYLFHNASPQPDPLLHHRVWATSGLDSDAMHRAAQMLLGEHDFSAFRGAGCQSVTPWRRVNRVWVRQQRGLVVLEIEANAFLLHMVRNIARGLHDIGQHGDSSELEHILRGRDRTRLGATAPAQGLYLSGVTYPEFTLPDSRVPFFLN